MNLRELLDQIEKVRGIAQMPADQIEVVIEDNSGIELVVDNVYFFEPNGIGFDVRPKHEYP